MSNEPLMRAYEDLAAQNIALRTMVALLFGEVALLHRDPHAKLDEMMTGLAGTMDKLSFLAQSQLGQGESISLEIAKTVENVRSMAEAVFPPRK